MRRIADISRAAAVCLLLTASGLPALAQDQQDSVTTGRRLALQLCSGCHFVTHGQRVPMAVGAPTFQEIARRPDTTEFALRNVIRTPHPIMPTLILSPDEADDIVSFIMSLKRSSL